MMELIHAELELAIVAFTTFFAVIGPIDVAAMFAVLTPHNTPAARKTIAIRGVLISAGILLTFALTGDFILNKLGISLHALKISGGILLLLIGIDMVFARHSGGTSTTIEENTEAATKADISVFPLATPLIAGPGAMGAVILLMADNQASLLSQTVVISMLMLVLLITLLFLLLATRLQKLLGVTGMQVINRVFGVLLTALAVQFMIDGVIGSGLVGGEQQSNVLAVPLVIQGILS